MTIRWRDTRGAEVYRAAAPRRPEVIVVRPGRKGLGVAGGAGLGGASVAAALFEYGVSHARALAVLGGVSVAVIAGVLLDRLAPRFFNRTEVTFAEDALEVRTRPLGDPRPTRVLYREIAGFEVEEIVDPMAAPPVVVFQVNARKTDGRLEPVFVSVDDADTAAWLGNTLTQHARG